MVNIEKYYCPKYNLNESILKLLIENKREWTILEIANELKKDYKNTFQAIKSIYPDLIYKRKKGNINLIEIKLIPKTEIYEVESKRTREFLIKNPKINLIKEDIERANYPFLIALLFGSFAKGTEAKTSDIDICLISDNREKTKEIISNINLLPQRTEIQSFTIREFESMLNKKENNLSKEIIKKNIILYGTENYYALVSKWMKKE